MGNGEKARMSTIIDLIGQKFGQLTILKREKNDREGKAQWLCKCDCGNEKIIRAYDLKSGKTSSCGCYRNKMVKAACGTHGLCFHPLYAVHNAMIQRCKNPNDKAFHNYGERGILVCDEWDDFEPFYHWATAYGYKQGLSIERINNNGNYEPSNCKWATRKEQANNTRANVWIKGKTISQWARDLNCDSSVLWNRVSAYGWSWEKALTTPIQHKKIKEMDNESL